MQEDISINDEFISDPILLEMILEELLANSLQYNLQEKAFINIEIQRKMNEVVIAIHDNGIGVRPEEEGKIFEMFYKTPVSKGSGLGLYIVKNAVDKLQGKVWMESTRNRGTSFYLLIPVKCAD